MIVPDKDFWRILTENAGIFNRAARYIQQHYPVSENYDRRDVERRAKRQPSRLAQITEGNCDDAESVLFGSFRSKNEKIRLDAAKFYLKTKGKERGYVERWEQTGRDGRDLMPNVQVEIIDSREQVDKPQNENTDN